MQRSSDFSSEKCEQLKRVPLALHSAVMLVGVTAAALAVAVVVEAATTVGCSGGGCDGFDTTTEGTFSDPDLTGMLDWARSDLTEKFDWSLSPFFFGLCSTIGLLAPSMPLPPLLLLFVLGVSNDTSSCPLCLTA